MLDPDASRGWEVSATPRPLDAQERDPEPIVQEAVWVLRPDWMGTEDFLPNGFRTSDRPVCSQSVY
jgi:hypothetical protein